MSADTPAVAGENTKRLAGALGQLAQLLRAARGEKPSKKDVSALREFFCDHPDLWSEMDGATSAAHTAVTQESDDWAVREVLIANYEGVKRSLGWEVAPPLERLLVEHLALCWLRVQCIEQRYAQIMAKSITLEQGRYWESRLSASQRRYLRAAETLARVRKMQLPPVQVNIGERQVNVVGGSER